MNSSKLNPVMPWQRVRVMWLVVLGPAVVVVASFVLLALAVRGADVPLKTSKVANTAEAMTPAHQARNHVGSTTR